MKRIHRIAIYAQHTTRAGEVYLGWDGEEESDDFRIYEGTREELLEDARRMRRAFDPRPGGSSTAYMNKVGRSIEEYLT